MNNFCRQLVCLGMSRRLKLGLAAALLFLVGTIGMTAWFYYAPHRAVARLHLALRLSDTNALAREIDFPAFQASLKQQINLVVTNKMAQDAPDGKVNPVAAAIAGGVVKYLVAQHATPEGLARLLSGNAKMRAGQEPAAPPNTAELDRAFDNAVREYRSGSQFVIYLTGQRGETTELILERQGLRWRLRHIVLPTDG